MGTGVKTKTYGYILGRRVRQKSRAVPY